MLLHKIPGGLYTLLYSCRPIRTMALLYKPIMYSKMIGRGVFEDKDKVSNTLLYKILVCVGGFAYTGSGAVTDFLKEFSNTTVLSNPDIETGKIQGQDDTYNTEIQFMKYPFSAIDIEDALCSRNLIKRWFCLKVFLQVQRGLHNGGGIYGKDFLELTLDFAQKIKSMLKQNKKITHKEYQSLCGEYYTKFLRTIPSKKYLVLDQALATFTSDTQKKVNILQGMQNQLKIICVYRDVRDVWASAVTGDDYTPPHDSVKAFVRWYKIRAKMIDSYLKDKHPQKLDINFSSLILHYEKTTKKIKDFLGLKEEEHINKGKCFIPEVSKKNVGLYKSLKNQKDIAYIQKMLPKYCFDKDIRGGGY